QEHDSVSTRIVANYNHMHALTVQYYEVVELYRIAVALSAVERCLFVPMKVLDFTDEIVRKYQGVLAMAALDRRARELLTSEFGSVKLSPTAPVQLRLSGFWATAGRFNIASSMIVGPSPGTPNPIAASAAPVADAGTSPAVSQPTNTSAVPRVFSWDRTELERVARLTSSTVARVDAADIYLTQNTSLLGLTVTTDQPGPVVSAVALKLHSGVAPIALTRTSVDWRVPQTALVQEVAEVLVTTQGQGNFIGIMTLELEYLGSQFPLTLPVNAGPNTTTSVCTIGGTEAGPELLRHLNGNRLYYNQAIWRSLDASTTALLLSKYRFESQSVANLIDPKPLQVAGNYLVFRMPGFLARRNLVEQTNTAPDAIDAVSRAAWRKWLDDKGLGFGPEHTTEQLVPVPTGGVFAEAVLGRSNSAEKLDVTRFWNWQDSPIPLQPPDIAAINMDSRAQAIDLRPGQLGQPVLNIVNPTSLPDPAGLGAILGALQNGNMFRDMSGLAATIGLAQATGSNATGAAADAARLAAANLQVAAQHDIEAKKIEMTTEAVKNSGTTGGSPKNISEMGSLMNSASARDKQKAADRMSSGSSTSGDIMPGVSGSTGLSMSSGSTARSLEDDAFRRALWGGLGVPASDLVLASAQSSGGPPVAVHLDESQLKAWIDSALEGTHI
ncbi:MAG: hypothetical protein JO112_21925, partial [Planctomycetes bacterium]|nr:hypothetical protein [Planctomycetota bacterium]